MTPLLLWAVDRLLGPDVCFGGVDIADDAALMAAVEAAIGATLADQDRRRIADGEPWLVATAEPARVWVSWDDPNPQRRAPDLAGAALLAVVRQVIRRSTPIPLPPRTVPAPAPVQAALF